MNDKEETQVNVAPGMSLMDVPKELAGNVRDIDSEQHLVSVLIIMVKYMYG